MKTPKNSVLPIIAAVAVCILGTLCGIFVWSYENMLLTSKFSFTTIILAAVR